MEHLFKSIIVWLHVHPTWVGVVGCLFTFYESLAIIGLTSPGSLTMSALGILIGSGAVPAVDIFVWTIIGAITGDSLSYWLGYRYHNNIRNLWPFSRFPNIIHKGEIFFNKYGGKGLFIGRFLAVRSIIPLVAGIMRVSPRKFFIADILSGILWPPIYMIPGILLGAASIHFVPSQALHIILVLLLIVFILWLIIWLSKLLTRLLIKRWTCSITYIWQKLKNQHSVLYKLLYEHENPLLPRPLSIAFFTLLGVVIFLLLFISILAKASWLQSLNLSTLSFFASLHNPAIQHIAIAISIYFGKVNVVFETSFLIALYFTLKRDWHAFWHFVALLFLAAVGIEGGKLISHHFRPNITIAPPHTYSFPSGHTLLSLILFGFMAFLIAHNNKKWLKQATYNITALIVIIVILSRLYLNVHWLSDVLGSVLLGGCILGIIVIAYRRKERHNRYRVLPLLLILIGGQIIFGSWYYHKHAKFLQKDFQLVQKQHYLKESRWWQSSHSLLPVYRHNRFAKPVQILNLQWLGSLNNVKQSLQQQGWQEPSHFGLYTLKQQLIGKKLTVLSPLTQQLQYHNAALILVKKLPRKNGYLILHLWNAHYYAAMASLYLGNISYHFINKNWLWHHKKNCTITYASAPEALQRDLSAWNFRTIQFKEQYKIKQYSCVKQNQTVLLIK